MERLLDQDWMLRATRALAPYDAVDLATTIGAFQLVPHNAGRLFGLEAAAAVIAQLTVRVDGPAMSSRRWRQLLNESGGALRTGVPDEDPFENPFVDELVYGGRAYRYLPGLPDESCFVLGRLLDTIELLDVPPTAALADAARRLSTAALAVSDRICRRAGLAPGCPPGDDFGGPVVLPPAARLGALKRSVSFTAEEMEAALAGHGVDPTALDLLVGDQGPTFPAAEWANFQPALALPIVRSPGGYVVIGPGALVPRLRHALVRLAVDRGATDAIVSAFRSAVFESVVKAMGFLGCDLLWGPLDGDAGGVPTMGGFFGLDSDKVVHAVLIADDLRSYDLADPLGRWPLVGLADPIERRLAAAEELAFATQPRLREMLQLVLLQGVGRFYMLGPATAPLLSERSQRLTMTAADLWTVGLVEGGTRLRLWQFAQARARLRTTAAVGPVAVLDEYDAWRGKGYSYYFGDERRPNAVWFAPGGAGNLRREVQRERDFHGALELVSGEVVEVSRLHDDPAVPIYVPTPWDTRRRRLAVMADVPSGPYWVVAPATVADGRYRSLYAEIAEMVAYWLWQLDPGLVSAGSSADVPPSPYVVHLEIEPDPGWFTGSSPADGGIDPVRCERLGDAAARLRLGPGAPDLFAASDNAGERNVLRALLRVLGNVAVVNGLPTRGQLDDERIDALLERYAPLGLKRKFFLVPAGADPLLDERELPPLRPVQDADEEEVLDQVGGFAQTQLGLPIGPIPRDRRTEVLGRVVDFLFAEVEALVARLDPAGLLETLVEHNEAILTAQARRRLTIPTQLACFESAELLAAQLRRQIPETSQAATASRVLIEYVTARPPTGDRALSSATYDRLLALVSQLQQWAFTSDEIHYGLVDHALEVLPSGRLGMERTAYLAAHGAFMGVRVLGEIGRGADAFDRYWRRPDDASSFYDDPAMARATAAEFGLPISGLVDFLRAVIDLGQAIPGAAKKLTEADLLNRLRADLGWPVDDVRVAFDQFAVGTRTEFRRPPAPYAESDAEPWNFNRGLSYLRKPLLVRDDGAGPTVVWGSRNVFLAGLTIVSLCAGGRYQPRTPELRQLVSHQRTAAATAFNDEVAALFETVPAARIRHRFKKAGSLRIQRANGQDLGDIDILVADPRRCLLLAVEAKDLAGARTPAEFSKDVREVLEAPGQRSASIDKHLERVAWVGSHCAEVLAELGLPTEDARRWRAQPLVVVNLESFAPFLVPPRVRVVSIEELKRELAGEPGR